MNAPDDPRFKTKHWSAVWVRGGYSNNWFELSFSRVHFSVIVGNLSIYWSRMGSVVWAKGYPRKETS